MRRDRGLLPVIGAGTLTAACGVGLLATSGWLITRASQRPAVLSLSIAIGAVQAFSLGRGLARYVERIAVHGLSLRLLGRVRLHLFDVAVPLVPGAVGGHGTGGVLSGFVSDTELVAQGYARGDNGGRRRERQHRLGHGPSRTFGSPPGAGHAGRGIGGGRRGGGAGPLGPPGRATGGGRAGQTGRRGRRCRSFRPRAGGVRARGPGRGGLGAGAPPRRPCGGPAGPGRRARPRRHHRGRRRSRGGPRRGGDGGD